MCLSTQLRDSVEFKKGLRIAGTIQSTGRKIGKDTGAKMVKKSRVINGDLVYRAWQAPRGLDKVDKLVAIIEDNGNLLPGDKHTHTATRPVVFFYPI